MEIWLIEDEEKTGPFQSYEVRSRIERGELRGGEMAWHESSKDWVPLREMELFRTEFEMEEERLFPPPVPVKPRPFVRFWARWFDWHLYSVFAFGLMRLMGLDMVAAVASIMFMMTYLLPWAIMEGISIHVTGTTPGKWLLGIRVQQIDGGQVTLGASVRRALRVIFYGIGLNVPIFREICHGIALWYIFKFRATWWDRAGGSEVRVARIPELRIVLFVFAFLGVMLVSGLVMKPLMDDTLRRLQEEYPQLIPADQKDEA